MCCAALLLCVPSLLVMSPGPGWAGAGHQRSSVPEQGSHCLVSEFGGVVFLGPLFPTDSTKTRKWDAGGNIFAWLRKRVTEVSFVFKEGHIKCKLIFKDFLIVCGKRNAPLKGDSSRDRCCSHTALLLYCSWSLEDGFSPVSPFSWVHKGTWYLSSHLRAPRHLPGAGRSETGPGINLSLPRAASRGKAAYPGCLRQHHLPTFGQLNVAREAALWHCQSWINTSVLDLDNLNNG